MISSILRKIDQLNKKKIFIQIGSNDGIIFDNLREFVIKDEWHGIMIEPVRETFDELVLNHKKSKNLKFLNVAISDKNENKIISYIPKKAIEENNLNISLKGCSTFHNNRQGDESIPMRVFENKQFLKQEEVKCITIETLIKEQRIDREIDLLQIDTEGHEYKIIKSINFDNLLPRVIIFETNRRKKMFSNEQIDEMFNILIKNNYSIIECGQDSIAMHSSFLEKIRE